MALSNSNRVSKRENVVSNLFCVEPRFNFVSYQMIEKKFILSRNSFVAKTSTPIFLSPFGRGQKFGRKNLVENGLDANCRQIVPVTLNKITPLLLQRRFIWTFFRLEWGRKRSTFDQNRTPPGPKRVAQEVPPSLLFFIPDLFRINCTKRCRTLFTENTDAASAPTPRSPKKPNGVSRRHSPFAVAATFYFSVGFYLFILSRLTKKHRCVPAGPPKPKNPKPMPISFVRYVD